MVLDFAIEYYTLYLNEGMAGESAYTKNGYLSRHAFIHLFYIFCGYQLFFRQQVCQNVSRIVCKYIPNVLYPEGHRQA